MVDNFFDQVARFGTKVQLVNQQSHDTIVVCLLTNILIMNTFLLDNLDLEIWEGWVGQTHSLAATWSRKDKKAQCGFQVFHATNGGGYTLMILDKGHWSTPLHQVRDLATLRRTFLKYMSGQIHQSQLENRYTTLVETSFSEAHCQFNQWMNDQVKTEQWLEQQK